MLPLHVVMATDHHERQAGVQVHDFEDPHQFKSMILVALGFGILPGQQGGSCAAVAHSTPGGNQVCWTVLASCSSLLGQKSYSI